MNEATTIVDVINWAGKHVVEILLFLSVFIEITPLKINPISFLMNLLFKPLKKDMADMKTELNNNINSVKTDLKHEIDKVKIEQTNQKQAISDLIKSLDMEEISRIRWEIIEFSISLDNNQLHTRDQYRHIKDDNKRYHDLIRKYGLTNGMFDEEMEKINKDI